LSTKLKVYDFKGILVKEIDTPLSKPEKVTKNDLNEWREERKRSFRNKDWYNRFGTVIEKYKCGMMKSRREITGCWMKTVRQ
jgi:hypothetical protein